MTAFTNIHVAPAQGSQLSTSNSQLLPRRRWLTNDPAREYAQRPGQVERLPDSVAALILSKQGYSKVGRNGIRIEGIADKPLNFWSESSVTIAEKAGTNEKVLWTLNRLNPDVLHILGKDGEYIESIPLDGKAPWFDQEAMARELGAKRRAQNRTIERVRNLHAPDTEKALEAADANLAAMQKALETKPIVHSLPARSASPSDAGGPISPRDRRDSSATPVSPGVSGQERIANATRAGTLSNGDDSSFVIESPASPAPQAALRRHSSFKKAERLHSIQRHLNGARTRHAERMQRDEDLSALADELLDELAPSFDPAAQPAPRL